MASKIKSKRVGYAPLPSVLQTFEWHKEGKFIPPIDVGKLRKLGVPEWNLFALSHTLQALLLIRDGYPTEMLDRLALSYQNDESKTEYQNNLKILIRNAYPEVINLIPNLEQVEPKQLYEIFAAAHYVPVGQYRKMISLFYGLCREAGQVPDEEMTPHLRDGRFASKTPEPEDQANIILPELEEYSDMSEPSKANLNGYAQPHDYSVIEGVLDALEVLRQLPKGAHWSEANRQSWLKAITINVNFLKSILEGEEEK